MRYLWQHAFQILDTYEGTIPLHHFLKQFYARYPKLGSRDRRALGDMAYAWYRCSKAFTRDSSSREETILACLYLCGLRPRALQDALSAAWGDAGSESFPERLERLQLQNWAPDLSLIFPIPVTFSAGIQAKEWQESLLRQPRLFLRIRKEGNAIARLLDEASIPFEWLSDTCLSLPNGSPIDRLLPPDAYVVQDASSQETAAFLSPRAGEHWWDCCAGAGGKSLLVKDLQPGIRLTASDIRESILHNLVKRFQQYRLQPPRTIVLDASDPSIIRDQLGDQLFDAILCDVPCTGSGTWARTPEQLFFFKEDTLRTFTHRQAAILRHAAARLAPGGRLYYITCSVFREENEGVLEKVLAETNLERVNSQLLNGISKAADCLFLAELRSRTTGD